MSLDDRQLKLVKSQVIQLAEELGNLSMQQAPDRCEFLAITLDRYGWTHEAEIARHLSVLMRDGKAHQRTLCEMLAQL